MNYYLWTWIVMHVLIILYSFVTMIIWRTRWRTTLRNNREDKWLVESMKATVLFRRVRFNFWGTLAGETLQVFLLWKSNLFDQL